MQFIITIILFLLLLLMGEKNAMVVNFRKCNSSNLSQFKVWLPQKRTRHQLLEKHILQLSDRSHYRMLGSGLKHCIYPLTIICLVQGGQPVLSFFVNQTRVPCIFTTGYIRTCPNTLSAIQVTLTFKQPPAVLLPLSTSTMKMSKGMLS